MLFPFGSLVLCALAILKLGKKELFREEFQFFLKSCCGNRNLGSLSVFSFFFVFSVDPD